jgi:hypothetical protein
MTNEEMRKESGDLVSDDRLLCFMYLLMRDKLPVGEVEQLVMEVENFSSYNIKYCNGWLAKYAQNLSQRIKKGSELDKELAVNFDKMKKSVSDDVKYKNHTYLLINGEWIEASKCEWIKCAQGE